MELKIKRLTETATLPTRATEGSAGYDLYADIENVIRMKKETNVHMIAPAFGTVHGVYKGEPSLNFELLKNISKEINTPLVMHGGSGLSEENFKKSIENGISKININTELKHAWTNSIKKYILENPTQTDPVFIIKSTEEEIKEVVRRIIQIFGSNNKA